MAPKKRVEAVKKRKKKMILLEVKKEIIKKHEGGMRLTDIAREYGRSASTIFAIIKMKEKITGRDAAKGVTVVSKHRPPVLEEVEKSLLLWIEGKQRAGDTVTEAIICRKAKALHADLLDRQPGASDDARDFKASRGWFDRFKTRSGIHSVARRGVAVSSDVAAAEELATDFLEVMVSEGYLPHQAFSCSQTGLFRKRVPKRTFVTRQEEPCVETGKTGSVLESCTTGDIKGATLGRPLQESFQPRVISARKTTKAQLPDPKRTSFGEQTWEGECASSRELKEACHMWLNLQTFVQQHHPNKALAQRLVNSFDTDVMSPFRGMLKRHQGQQTVERFLLKQPKREEPACVSPAQLPPPSSKKC